MADFTFVGETPYTIPPFDEVDFSFAPVMSSSLLKYWNGVAWIDTAILKYWNGTSWAVKTLKYWNGTTWVVAT